MFRKAEQYILGENVLKLEQLEYSTNCKHIVVLSDNKNSVFRSTQLSLNINTSLARNVFTRDLQFKSLCK